MKDIAINNCSKEIGGPLHNLYCNATTGICEEYYTSNFKILYVNEWFLITFFFITDHETSTVRGIKGLASGVFFDNLGGSFLEVSVKLAIIIF